MYRMKVNGNVDENVINVQMHIYSVIEKCDEQAVQEKIKSRNH